MLSNDLVGAKTLFDAFVDHRQKVGVAANLRKERL